MCWYNADSLPTSFVSISRVFLPKVGSTRKGFLRLFPEGDR